MFNLSLLKVLETQPHQVDVNGNVTQTLNGVFILFSDELIEILRAGLTQAEKTELAAWVNRYTAAQCAAWNVPVWAGNDTAVYARVPASIWNDPLASPPPKVRRFFQHLWREAND